MKKNHLLIAIIFLLNAFLFSCESKTDPVDSDGTDTTSASTITGQVVSSLTGENLSGAIITMSDGDIVKGATTDEDGKFSYNYDLESDRTLTIIAFKAGYFKDTTTVFAIADETIEVPIFKLDRDESSNAGDFSGRAASIYLYAQTDESVGVKESGSLESMQLVFEIMDSSGIVIGENNSVDVSFRFGSAPGGGEYLYPASVTSNALGKVFVSLNTGTVAGVAQIIAEAVVDGKPIASKPVMIAIHGGFPDSNHFSLGTEYLNYPYYYIFNGIAKVSVLVGDKYSNPTREGTSVYFNTDAGVIEGSATTDELGQASVSLISGNPLPYHPVYQEGYFYVHGRTIDEDEKLIKSKSLVLFSGVPVVTLTPLTVDIENGGTQSFSYTVTDNFGNPLAHGNKYTVIVETKGSAGASGDVSITMGDAQFGTPTYFFSVVDLDDSEIDQKAITVRVVSEGPNGRGVSLAATGLTR